MITLQVKVKALLVVWLPTASLFPMVRAFIVEEAIIATLTMKELNKR